MKNKAASELAKLRHKKNPPTKEFMKAISKKGLKKRWGKKRLSPPRKIDKLKKEI